MLKRKKKLLVGLAMSTVLTVSTFVSALGVFAEDADSFKRVKIKLDRIECVAVGEDPGDNIEVYGNLTLDGKTLWQLGENDAVDINEYSACNIGIEESLVVDAGGTLKISGQMYEEDPWYNGDDNMGYREYTINYNELFLDNSFTLEFQEGNQTARAVFIVTKSREYQD